MNGTINIYKELFSFKDKVIYKSEDFTATVFKYSTGVDAVKIENSKGHLTVLPFMGQMIWDMEFLGHNCVMKSMFDEPEMCEAVYGESYGCFLMHCGVTFVGQHGPLNPGPFHAELPIAKYQTCFINIGEDEKGKYISIGGLFNFRRAYRFNYDFTPEYRLYADASTIEIIVNIKNNKAMPLEYYYLCHINYGPVEGSRVLCTAKKQPKTDEEFSKICGKKSTDEGYEFIRKLIEDPSEVDIVDDNIRHCHREVSYTYESYAADDGFAHTLQIMPDGCSCYVKHDPVALPVSVRWMGYTGDEKSLGMVLPSTTYHASYNIAKELGHDKYLAQGEDVTYRITTGILTPEETKTIEKKIK